MNKRIAYACALALLLPAHLPALAGPRGASAPPPAPPLIQEPALNTIVANIKATADFANPVSPGKLINVKLELGGSSALSAASSATTPGTLTDSATAKGQGGGGRPAGAVAGPTNSIPCCLWPGGCPAPITLGTGVQLTNFELRVKWDIFEVVNGERVKLVENQDYQGIGSPNDLSRAFVMAPLRVMEYTGAAPQPSDYLISAAVTVVGDKIVTLPPSTTKVTSLERSVDVKPLISLLPLEVPKVFVLFLDKGFGGAAAIYFPKNTVFQDNAETKLFEVAGKLLDTYKTVRDRLSFVGWFASYVTGLEELHRIRDLPHVDVKERKDEEKDLNDDDFIHRSWWGNLNDTEVEDESSSVLLLGPPGVGAKFFQDYFGGGEFDVLTGDPRVGSENKPPLDYGPAIQVRDFNDVNTSVPPGKVTIVKKFRAGGQDRTPNDRVSSFRWVH